MILEIMANFGLKHENAIFEGFCVEKKEAESFLSFFFSI